MKTETVVNDVKTVLEVTSIVLDGIIKGEYQKEKTMSAQLRQVVKSTSEYPSKRISNSMSDNLFDVKDFGFEAGKTFETTENRVTWMNVPEAATPEQVQILLDKANANNARLYRVLSNYPILTEDQEFAITNDWKTMNDFADAQVVRYGEGVTVENEDVSGQIILDKNGKVQYRQIFFSATGKADEDRRTTAKDDFFISDAIITELEGAQALTSQHI